MNDNTSWISLAAAVANVVRWLEAGEKHQKDRERQTAHERENEQRAEQHVDGVQRGLKKRPSTGVEGV
jgi:hypothetical protein